MVKGKFSPKELALFDKADQFRSDVVCAVLNRSLNPTRVKLSKSGKVFNPAALKGNSTKMVNVRVSESGQYVVTVSPSLKGALQIIVVD